MRRVLTVVALLLVLCALPAAAQSGVALVAGHGAVDVALAWSLPLVETWGTTLHFDMLLLPQGGGVDLAGGLSVPAAEALGLLGIRFTSEVYNACRDLHVGALWVPLSDPVRVGIYWRAVTF